MMARTRIPSPSAQKLTREAGFILSGYNPRTSSFLSTEGEWEDKPRSLRDIISGELLFRLSRCSPQESASIIKNIFHSLSNERVWTDTKKLYLALKKGPKKNIAGFQEDDIDRLLLEEKEETGSRRPKGTDEIVIVFEVLIWVIHFESLRLRSEEPVPGWDRDALLRREDSLKKRLDFEGFLDSVLTGPRAGNFKALIPVLKEMPPPLVKSISAFASEVDKLMSTINGLLIKSQDSKFCEECQALIVEKIQPPMGIVTHTSPALLIPCLDMLRNTAIDSSSGIPYTASVILSILQDPRSEEALLEALGHYPLSCTKIRENIIYTLGNLKAAGAVRLLEEILKAPDETRVNPELQVHSIVSLLEQKIEAIWALGKIGYESLKALPALVQYADHPSSLVRTYLAWTLGEVGKAQKARRGGVDAELVIALLKLLKTKNRQVFEESANALKKIDMPDFVHSLYLYNVGAISILGLKPAQKGLYELSETLHHMLRSQGRTIIAVNGDSGTGKTYFCDAIKDGFGDLKSSQILYLMRDRKKGQNVFNRMLGLGWLKKHIDPNYYHDYPLSEDEDNPEEFFKKFLEENSDKRLIILDGCRDELYFQRVIDLFYSRGELDIEVNFRADFSTRRLNLEEREIALESVKIHLSFLEDPVLEDTPIYQEGIVILYDLDNSSSSRLVSHEVRELFAKSRIDSWGDLIRIGDFAREPQLLTTSQESISVREEDFSVEVEKLQAPISRTFSPYERHFKAVLNENLDEEPNLLQVIPVQGLKADRLRFYAQDQVAGTGEEGSVFVLTFMDKRLFSTDVDSIEAFTLLGRDFYIANHRGEIQNISFERNEVTSLAKSSSRVLKLAPLPRDRIISGHEDGSVRVWDFHEKTMLRLEGHSKPILSLASDYQGRIYSGSSDGSIKQWDTARRKVKIIDGLGKSIPLLKLYPQGKILALTENSPSPHKPSQIRILDFEGEHSRVILTSFGRKISSVIVYHDGRIIAGLAQGRGKDVPPDGTLAIISPQAEGCYSTILGGHGLETKDCLTMGPKIISCGREMGGDHTLRLWGSAFYVRMELGKLSLQS